MESRKLAKRELQLKTDTTTFTYRVSISIKYISKYGSYRL